MTASVAPKGLKIELTTFTTKSHSTIYSSSSSSSLELLVVKHQMDWKKCTITLHKLQALMEDASLVLRIAEFPNERILVHLRQPLIAVARLS
jgi:hypothetical protein